MSTNLRWLFWKPKNKWEKSITYKENEIRFHFNYLLYLRREFSNSNYQVLLQLWFSLDEIFKRNHHHPKYLCISNLSIILYCIRSVTRRSSSSSSQIQQKKKKEKIFHCPYSISFFIWEKYVE